MRGSRKCMSFAISRIWREPINHHDDCYFCIADISKYKDKGEEKIVYPSIPSSIAPVNHGPELPITQPPTTHATSSTSLEDDDDADFEVDTQCSSKDPNFLNQNELDDLTRDMFLTKAKAEILFSRLKE